MADDVVSWTRRLDLDEPPRAFHAFVHYRDLPPTRRSLDRAYSLCRMTCRPGEPASTSALVLLAASPTWKRWKKQFLWTDRAADYDAAIEAETRSSAILARREMHERHAEIAKICIDKIVVRLESLNPDELSAGALICWLEKAAAVERAARGVPTSIVEVTPPTARVPPDLSKYTDAELDELERLLAIAETR